MKLVWAKIQGEVIVGEVPDLLSVTAGGATIHSPMTMQHISVMQPPSSLKVPGRQSAATSVTGFKLLPIPCSQIFVNHVDYCGEIKERDPLYVTYYAVKKQVDQQGEALMVNQS
jgi:hypothetical protein